VIALLNPQPVIYVCDDCTARMPVNPADHRIPMHNCRGRALMSLPMIREGERAEVRLVERDDYVAGEDVRTDAEGRVFMRCEVHREDGHADVWVYAPTAYARTVAGEAAAHGGDGRGEG
jgi:hypothetical protein